MFPLFAETSVSLTDEAPDFQRTLPIELTHIRTPNLRDIDLPHTSR
jgi:hypothetical protein